MLKPKPNSSVNKHTDRLEIKTLNLTGSGTRIML